MPADVRAAMLDPMSKQRISVNKWGINATLRTETSVVAAGNPKYGRFDPYEPVQDQFDLESNLLSRFDLVFTLTDQPNPDRDSTITAHILDARDAAKRQMAGMDVDDELAETIATPVDRDLLRKWIALAKQQPEPVFANDEVKAWLDESFTDLRSLNGYDSESPVPVTFRKLEGIVRIAEAAAKFEFSETIEMRHVKFATKVVGESMQDYGTDESGQYDADVQETGSSMSQKQTMKLLGSTIEELQPDNGGGADPEDVVEQLEEEGIDTGWGLIDKAKEKGMAYEPQGEGIRWVGGA
jgi:replicative DNA helicase Mcm